MNKFKIPVWKQQENTTIVTFPDVAHNKKSEGIIEGITEGISRTVIVKFEGVIEGIADDVKDKITKILLVLYKKSGIMRVDMEKLIDIPIKSLERYIKQLRDANIIEFRGANKTGGYYLAKATEVRLNLTE